MSPAPLEPTKRLLRFAVSFAMFCGVAAADTVSPISFVEGFVGDLGHIHQMRNKAAEDVTSASGDYTNMATACIRNSTSLALELRSEAARYSSLNLPGQFSALGPAVANLWQVDADLNDQMSATCLNLLSASDVVTQLKITRGVFAQLSAKWDYQDESIFKAVMPMAMYSLISDKPDSKGHMSLLNITTSERANLLSEIEKEFGSDLGDKKPGYLVASIVLLKGWLQNQGFKSTDEPN